MSDAASTPERLQAVRTALVQTAVPVLGIGQFTAADGQVAPMIWVPLRVAPFLAAIRADQITPVTFRWTAFAGSEPLLALSMTVPNGPPLTIMSTDPEVLVWAFLERVITEGCLAIALGDPQPPNTRRTREVSILRMPPPTQARAVRLLHQFHALMLSPAGRAAGVSWVEPDEPSEE